MADWITYKLTGAESLVATFRKLPQEVQRQIAVPAGMEAMRIVLASARARAANVDDPATANYIPKNINIMEDKKFFAETGSTKISVGVKRRKGNYDGGNTYYWWWVELGTSHIRSQPFMRSALADNREAVFQEFLATAKLQLIKLEID